MAIINLTYSKNTEGVVTTTETSRSALEATIDVVAMPFGITADDGEFVQKNLAAKAILGWSAVSLLLGEAYGNRRGRQGQSSFIPVFR